MVTSHATQKNWNWRRMRDGSCQGGVAKMNWESSRYQDEDSYREHCVGGARVEGIRTEAGKSQVRSRGSASVKLPGTDFCG